MAAQQMRGFDNGLGQRSKGLFYRGLQYLFGDGAGVDVLDEAVPADYIGGGNSVYIVRPHYLAGRVPAGRECEPVLFNETHRVLVRVLERDAYELHARVL